MSALAHTIAAAEPRLPRAQWRRGYTGPTPCADLMADAKPCPSFPGYSITVCGRVFSHWTRKWIKGGGSVGWIADAPVREIVSSISAGYVKVSIWSAETRRSGRVGIHVLLLDAWVAPRPAGLVGRHLDDVKLNNDLGNLAWGTQAENAQDAIRNGRTTLRERNASFKITDDDVVAIRAMRQHGAKIIAIAETFGISRGSVELIIYRRGRFS